MRSARAGKPPPKRRGRTLPDLLWGDLQRRDLNPAPPVTEDNIRKRLHPIEHSSQN